MNESHRRIVVRRKLLGCRKICPWCLNELKSSSSLGGWLTPDIYECEKCGYHGYVAFEEDKDHVQKR